MITTTHRAWRAIVGRVAATALVAALPALLPVSAFAQQSAAGRVTQVYVDKSGKFARVMLDAPAVNPGNCAGGDYYIVEFPADTSRGPMLAALYMALSQRLPVSMWVLGCTTVEYWGKSRPMAHDVYLGAP